MTEAEHLEEVVRLQDARCEQLFAGLKRAKEAGVSVGLSAQEVHLVAELARAIDQWARRVWLDLVAARDRKRAKTAERLMRSVAGLREWIAEWERPGADVIFGEPGIRLLLDIRRSIRMVETLTKSEPIQLSGNSGPRPDESK